MSEPVKIVVIIHEGVVQDVITAGVAVSYVVADFDIEGADKDQLKSVDLDTWNGEALIDGPYPALFDGARVLAVHTP